jgi:hypothetical protein
LIDVNGSDRTVEMKNDSYGDHIRKILNKLKIDCNKLLHLGRNLGSKILDLLEVESEAIRRMGQWNPNTFDNSYSSKLPLGPIRNLAGYSNSSKIYFNTRTSVDPPFELLELTPIGVWVYEALRVVNEDKDSHKYRTVVAFLEFMKELNKVFLQDAAAMLAFHPDRVHHPIFTQLEVFHRESFGTFFKDMKAALEVEEDPLDANLEKVLPGIHQRLAVNHTDIKQEIAMSRQEQRIIREEQRLAREEQQRAREEQKMMFADLMHRMASSLLEVSQASLPLNLKEPPSRVSVCTNSVNTASVSTISERNSRHTENSQMNSVSTILKDVSQDQYTMTHKYASLEDIWNEWHGLEQYSNPGDGVVGGIEAREKRYGKKWRKHISSQHYSRTLRIVKMMKSKQMELGSDQAMMEALQPVFEQSKNSLSSMITACQQLGYIAKQKPRGRRKRPANEIETTTQQQQEQEISNGIV